MSDGRRKINKQSTGTVPKIKHRNNTTNERRDSPRSWTNNLSSDLQRSWNLVDGYRSSSSSTRRMMNTVEEQRHLNTTVNGSITPNSSSSAASRRNSGAVPKCDNISKYPDKKQIQDKLSQIREYLQITTSLMASIKNSDECGGESDEKNNLAKMVNDLRDSEAKLVNILENYELDDNEVEHQQAMENEPCSSDSSSHIGLVSLQQKAENKLKDARQIQEKLMAQSTNNDINQCLPPSNRSKDKNFEHDFDGAIKELEERTKRLREPTAPLSEKVLSEVESLHNEIMNLHHINEDRTQLIQVLDNRDAELKSQHTELQTKLHELQNRKQQVDQLVAQLHNVGECCDDDDVAGQVKRIVTMKEQLGKLKDMLELVKTTETVMQNSNSQEMQDLACDICTKAENFLQKQPQNNPENTYKPVVNKNDYGSGGGAKPRHSHHSNVNKIAIQVELEAKKRELEEIMGKHNANGISNLNQDVGSDNKSEFSCSSNTYMGTPWLPLDNNRHQSSDSHECSDDEVNDYSTPQHRPNEKLCLPSYPQRRAGSEFNYRRQKDAGSLPCTPERNLRQSLPPNYREPSSNIDEENKNQVQMQLELIRSLCDSMLEQQRNGGGTNGGNIQLRNNLTPSPIHLEPRRFASPSPLNALNVINPIDMGLERSNNAQNWLVTNTLQTQSFMINTLNQCCQTLWLQQKELLALRQMVSQLQDRMDSSSHFDNNPNHLTSSLQQSTTTNPIRSNPKINQVSAACSMPNLNQYNVANVDPTAAAVHFTPTPNNMQQTVRLMDPLNNVNLNSNNALLHGVNAAAINPWNGQALNNQVAPGNRANNYWDNFRSYSRQNLLSTTTKSNEGGGGGFHHQQNLASDRTNPFHLISSSSNKSNSGSQENPPRRGTQFVSINRNVAPSSSSPSVAPPDVLNINHNVSKMNEHIGSGGNNRSNEIDNNFHHHHFCTNNGFSSYNNETSSNTSLISEDLIFKDCIPENTRRRNEWHDDGPEENFPKSKLFEELRESVYKEVASLISANEARPHFLIQLFRDLQMISSDPLRLKILQSIQTVITHSLATTNNTTNNCNNNNQTINEQELNQMVSDCFSLQSTVWSNKQSTTTPAAATTKNPPITTRQQDDPLEMQNSLKEIIPFLNDQEDEIIHNNFLLLLKHMLIESESFQETVKDSVFQKHFSNVLDEVLAQYNGKKVKDVKMHIIQTISDLLRGELSFIQLIQDTCPENCVEENDEQPPNLVVIDNNGQIQNGDLAEADQGRGVEDEDVEEEGAVGGFWELTQEQNMLLMPNMGGAGGGSQIINSDDMDLTCEFTNAEAQTQFIKQGLDQVPTRLPTKSRSNTPNKDRTTSRSDHQDF